MDNKLMVIEETIKNTTLAMISTKGKIEQAIMMADGIIKLRDGITKEMMDKVLALQDRPLGFLTDRKSGNKAPYDAQVVRDCAIEALIRGVSLIGNEFNIIAGRCYITREGYSSLLRNLPGLQKLSITLGVPQVSGKGALVPCSATWEYNGIEGKKEASIPVKTDDYSTVDAILGKADRKFRKRIWDELTGTDYPEGEVSDLKDVQVVEIVEKKPQANKMLDKMGVHEQPKPLEVKADAPKASGFFEEDGDGTK